MAIAHIAFYFDAGHAVAFILGVFNNGGLNGRGETWPTRARFKFGARVEEYCATATTGIKTWLMCFAVLSAKCAFSSLFPANQKFFRGEELFPFPITFGNSLGRNLVAFAGVMQHVQPLHSLEAFTGTLGFFLRTLFLDGFGSWFFLFFLFVLTF